MAEHGGFHYLKWILARPKQSFYEYCQICFYLKKSSTLNKDTIKGDMIIKSAVNGHTEKHTILIFIKLSVER